jgi:tRNA(Ile)-lysidine synthase
LRSHPPTLITLARAALRDHALVPPGSTLLVAVSGGPDSMALLHVMAILRARAGDGRHRGHGVRPTRGASGGFGLFAHGVDHGLRPEAESELDVAAAFSRDLDVPFSRSKVMVEPGGNLQARARAARWASLRTAASRVGAARIATGHHADDRAETLIMRLLRGTGTKGLAVLPPLEGDRIRPLYRARRSDIDAHVARHRIPFALDPSNNMPRFLRTRVRRELIPQLIRLNPRVVEHLCALADDAHLLRASGEVDD